jgi:hypothetical protein
VEGDSLMDEQEFSVTFTRPEGQALVELLNVALKANGISALNNVSFWLTKLETAEEVDHGDTSPECSSDS